MTTNYELAVCDNGQSAFFEFYNGSYLSLTANYNFGVKTWHHLVATYDRSTIRIYADGVEVANTPQTAAMIANNNTLSIGRVVRDSNTNFGEFPGLIDDARIYNRALSPSEVKRLYNMGHAN